MAVSTYKVQRNDTVWGIVRKPDLSSSISGSTPAAKEETLIKLNNLKSNGKTGRDRVVYIYVGQVLKLNESGSGSGENPEPTNKPKITAFGLQAFDNTESKLRTVIAAWSFKKEHTKHFKCRWEQYVEVTAGVYKWQRTENTTTSIDDVDAEYPESYCHSEFTADELATKVRFQVLPVAQNKKNSDTPYWKEGKGDDDVAWSDQKEYDFSNNPPVTPPSPRVSIVVKNDKQMLQMNIDTIDPVDLEADRIQFQIAKDNVADIFTSNPIKIVTNQVSCEHQVVYGSKYKVRARSVNSKNKESGWSDYSENVETPPLAPDAILDCSINVRAEDGAKYVRLEWTPVANATNYVVEYVNNLADFDNSSGQIGSTETAEGSSFIEIFGLDADANNGKTYFFRIRSKNSAGTGPYVGPVELTVGETPAAPTTWSSAESVFRGEQLELHWMHNSKDNSKQTYAQLSVNLITDTGESGWETFTFKNTTTLATGERIDETIFKYGRAYSYKGDMYVWWDTESSYYSNAEVQWKVRTAGITKTFSDIDWSIIRTVKIYEKPTLELSVTSDPEGKNRVDTLNTFPFYIHSKVLLDSYDIQYPVGYHLHIVSNADYETIDENGTSKSIKSGDVVYNSYFDTSNVMKVTMTAADIDLESGVTYTVRCVADMNSGLAVEQHYDFDVVWSIIGYSIDADILVSKESLSAIIQPYCMYNESIVEVVRNELYNMLIGELSDEDMDTAMTMTEDPETTASDFISFLNGKVSTVTIALANKFEELRAARDKIGQLASDVTMSVYRRDYDGTFTEIASDIPNRYTAITDHHPALDYARYRIIARDTKTGSISFFDKIGVKVGCTSVVIQWDEEHASFDLTEDNPIVDLNFYGSMLILPYNVSISDDRKRDVALVNYAGRERPVSYHGVTINETSSWTAEIPKSDVDTIYTLRQLSLWNGNVYVREPSGMGFWATVNVKFNINYDSMTIPVTLSITRVEGGA